MIKFKLYKIRAKKKLKELETNLKVLEDQYNNIKFESQAKKAHVWVEIKKHQFAIENFKSI